MHPHLPRRLARLAGLAAMAVAAVTSAGAPVAAASARTAGAAAGGSAAQHGTGPALAASARASVTARARASTAAATSRPVLLIDGQRLVRTGPGGRLAAMEPSSQGSFAVLFTTTFCGQISDVPADALPFVGRGLDPSLFRLSALRRREHAGRLPVRVSYHGRRAPALPGVIITHAAAGTADGFLTPGSARKFGAALQRQFLADHARASYGTDGLFARGVTIALAGAAAPHPVRPQFVMHTLTVKGRNLAGRPDTGDDVLVFNADNCARFGDFIETDNFFRHGDTRFSVPAGHYWAAAQFLRFSGGEFRLRLAILPQFTVAGNTTVHVAARSASSKITITTPRPAVSQVTSFSLIRGGQAGTATGISWSGINTEFWVSPTSSKPTAGSLQSFTSAELTSRPGAAAVPYAYNLDFAGPPGLIPGQHFAVRQASLATVNERYYQDAASTGAWTTAGGTPAQLGGGGELFVLLPLKLPGRQIQYMSGGPALWSSQYWEFSNNRTGNLFAGQADSPHALRPGQHVTENWNRYPLHPAPDVSLARGGFPAIPSAGRAGNLLTLETTPFSDNEPGHLGTGFFTGFFGGSDAKMSGHYEIDQNGARLAAGNAVNGIPSVRLSAQPSVLRFALSAARTGKHYVLSPASRTVWTWRSRRDPAARVPPPWICFTALTITQQCAVQPMMTLRYQVAGLAMTGSARPGRQLIGLSVGHIQLARAPAITGAHMQVSFDGGKTWRPAAVTAAGHGRFRAAFRAPAGAFVTLRASATDAAGGAIGETILRAYKIAGAGPPAAATMALRRAAAPAAGGFIRPACAAARPQAEQCFLAYRPQAAVNRAIVAGVAGQASRPRGLSPRAIRAAYRLPARRTSHQTVAVSIAFDTPRLAHFLAVYRKHFGLPACTAASRCFRKLNQRGKKSPMPQSGAGTGWDLEATLDVSMISVACPHCHILVIEANDPSDVNLAKTEDAAARLGAQVISNSYGSRENGFALAQARSYGHRGHTVVASAGDLGFTAASFPANLATVTSVGGTKLARAANHRGWRERIWNDGNGAGGSGCSAYVSKPSWQHDRHCAMRTVADVSAVATNVPIFSSTYGGWVTVAGTSIGAPLVAGIYGLAGNGARTGHRRLYRHASSFFDITKGNNSFFEPAAEACGSDYLCVAKQGYDAPSGLGSPRGTRAF